MANDQQQGLAPKEASGGASMTRTTLAGTEIERRDTAAIAMAERQRALVQAAIAQARHFPRDEVVSEQKLIVSCTRPTFAAKGVFSKKQGKKEDPKTGQKVDNYVTGLTVRVAEEVARVWGNLDIAVIIIHDDSNVRIYQVSVTDLETNLRDSKEVPIEKTVERRFIDKGVVPLATRRNSYGDMLYILEATAEEMTVKSNAELAKVKRNLILNMIPAHVKEAAREALDATVLLGADAADPMAKRKELFARFLEVGVTAENLGIYLQHSVDEASRDELLELHHICNAIEDRETSWREVMEGRGAVMPTGEVKPADEGAAKRVKEKIDASKKKRSAPKTPPPPTGQQPATGATGATAATTAASPATSAPAGAGVAQVAKPGADEVAQLVESAAAASTEEEVATLRGALVGATTAKRLDAEQQKAVELALHKASKRIEESKKASGA